MIHGAFCGGWAFEEFARPFKRAGFAVQTPSLRHHDCGAHPPEALAQTSLLDYADDLAALIGKLNEKPILLGHSLGGLLAQMLAARGLARATVLLAPSAPWGVVATTFFEMASAQAMFLTGDFWNRVLPPRFDIAAANSLDKLSDQERQAVYERFVPESGLATFETMLWAIDAKRASEVQARDVVCPLLCLAGEKDQINPPSTVRRIAARYGGRAVFEELAGKSHWLIGERGWEDVAARVLKWLDGVLARTPERRTTVA